MPTEEISSPLKKTCSRKFLAFCLVLFICAIASTNLASAQSSNGDWQSFVNSIGKTLYFAAWPTATYDGVSLQDVSGASGGVDIRFRLYGTSAFDGSSLWTDVVLELRNGKIDSLRWGRNNAILAQPGETMKSLGDLMVELNKQYDQNRGATPSDRPLSGAPEGLSAVCLNNPSKSAVSYSLEVNGKSEDHTVQPGSALITWAYGQSDFDLSFDDSFDEGYTGRNLHLQAAARSNAPTTCDDDMTYDFVVEGNLVGLNPRRWIPGFEHPFNPSVVRAQKEGDWVCAPGEKWSAPDDTSILDCVPNNVGLLGISITLENGSEYPKIMKVARGMPADRAGVTAGSYLLAVDGVSLQGLSLADDVNRLRGAVNTTVRIRVSTDSYPRVLELQRQ